MSAALDLHEPPVRPAQRKSRGRHSSRHRWWFREAAPDCIVLAVPNDGCSRSAKRPGVLAGVPDIAIIDGQGRPAFLKLKAPGRYQEPEQRALMARLAATGVRCAVVRSLDEAKALALRWGLVGRVLRETVGTKPPTLLRSLRCST